MLEIFRYHDKEELEWDAFVSQSKNAPFLFFRSYQDYHADRFPDHSYIFRKHGRIVALLPASRSVDELCSHGGLTFGGILSDSRMTQKLMLDVFDVLMTRLRSDGVKRLVYKACPFFYQLLPAEEDVYALFRNGATLYRRDLNSIVCPNRHPTFQKRRLRAISKAVGRGLSVSETKNFGDFWEILEENLQVRHRLKPVHTLEEITMLHQRFPKNIRLFAAHRGTELIAGAVVFENQGVAHCQYFASSPHGRESGALDLVIFKLISEIFSHKSWISLGVSTESEGTILNRGLVEYKEGFGARSVTQDFFEICLD